MLVIGFSGWAMCRLATDPDPYDDPRGVSGYMRAYAGEPDLDRIIHFQSPPFRRDHTPTIGVGVVSVVRDGVAAAGHPLLGASVDLLGKPVFEGRNGVIAEDTKEPICPFDLEVRQGQARFSRATVPTDPASPYREFGASGFAVDPGLLEAATGIASLAEVWQARLTELEAELDSVAAEARPGLEERIEFLRQNLEAGPGGGAHRYFPARMEWNFALRSPLDATPADIGSLLDGFPATVAPWRARFWFGGWDADAQSFFVVGSLEIPAGDADQPQATLRRPERMSDIRA